MAYTGIGYNEVQLYFKSCSTKRLEKLNQDINIMLIERDEKSWNKGLKATHKKVTGNKKQHILNFGDTD